MEAGSNRELASEISENKRAEVIKTVVPDEDFQRMLLGDE